MTTPDFETLEVLIRAETDKKLQAAKTLAAARRVLQEAREAFAKADAENVAAYDAALRDARTAGFTDKLLAELKLTDPKTTPKPRRANSTTATNPKPKTKAAAGSMKAASSAASTAAPTDS